MLCSVNGMFADNHLVITQSIRVGNDEGGWGGNTIPASAFEGIELKNQDIIEISRSGSDSKALQVSAGTWGDAIQIFQNYGWTNSTEYIRIGATTVGETTYTADEVIAKIKEKGLIVNGTGPMDVKVRVILIGNSRINLSGAITYTGMTDKIAQIGDPVTYTYTLNSKFADLTNVKYKWFITDLTSDSELDAGNGYVYEYVTGQAQESNTFTFIPRSATSEKQLRVCVHVSADGYGTNYNADWGHGITIAPMHTPTITQDGTNVTIKVNDGHWLSYKVNNGEEYSVYGSSVTLPNDKITSLNNNDVITAHTWRSVDLGSGSYAYPGGEYVSYTYYTGYTITWDGTKNPSGACQAYYTLNDGAEHYTETMHNVAPGTKVSYYANADGSSAYEINGWRSGEGEGTWLNYGKTTTVESLSENIYIWPEFKSVHYYDAKAGEHGSAIAYTNTETKENISGKKVMPWTSTAYFFATADYKYKFKQWNDGNTDNPRTVTGNETNTHYEYTAEFEERTDLQYVTEIKCNHCEGAYSDGANLFPLDKLNTGNGATTSNNGHTINLPTNGGYISFCFDKAYNMYDLSSWVIGDNDDLKSRVSSVEFFNNGVSLVNFYNSAADRKSLDNDSKNKLKSVTEIRIWFNGAAEAASYDISWIVFRYVHADRTLPTLINGTASEMTLYTGETLNLANTPGYWRQYTDGNYTTIKEDGLVPAGGEWLREYTFSNMQNGDYYFGARDGGRCALDYLHETELVTVHVSVTNPPTNLTVTYDLNATGVTGSAPVDANTYNYKDDAVVLAPGTLDLDGYYFDYWSLNPDGSGQRYSTDSDLGSTTINLTSQNTTLYAIWAKKGYVGYFNFENRLIAQWNFDLCDGARFHETSASSALWDKSTFTEANGDVKTTYTLKEAIGDMDGIEPIGGELVYAKSGDAANVKIPIAAGLKFTAAANTIKIRVTKNSSGVITNTQLILSPTVKMEVPYVRNSYRNDLGSTSVPYKWANAYNPTTNSWQNYTNSFSEESFYDFMDCIHHVNRDILYVSSSPNLWDGSTNTCYDDDTRTLFNSGGDEDVHGLPEGVTKKWLKYNFTGNQGTKCIITFTKETTIDRIAVNRNLVYSFYTEHLAVTSNGAYTKPYPGLRLVGTPRGGKVADVGGTYASYDNAIAMTYGGWSHNSGTYKDGDNNTVTDSWGNLTVYHGDNKEGDNDYSSSKYEDIDVTKVPVATDGFPVYSSMVSQGYSESVNPNQNSIWHDPSYGIYQYADNSSLKNRDYLDNFTPWTLPARGAHVKFEPTYPGVLNVLLFQEGKTNDGAQNYYYIADEFGNIVKDNVYTKTGTGASNPVKCTTEGYFYVENKDNVKYSFDVYPGKTYYMFSNTAGMGVTGFNFEPYVYRLYNNLSEVPNSKVVNKGTDKVRTINLTQDEREIEFELARQDVGIKTADMTAGPEFAFLPTTDVRDYTNQTAAFPGGSQLNYKTKEGEDQWHNKRTEFDLDENGEKQVVDGFEPEDWAAIDKSSVAGYPSRPATNVNPLKYDNKAVHVNLNRSFVAGKWQTICLPYSMNNLQLESVFGTGTKVVLLRDIQPGTKTDNGATTANFVYHMNQDIIAGYPYLIYPANSVSNVGVNVYLDKAVSESDLAGYAKDIDGDWTAPVIVEISSEGPNIVTYGGPTYGGITCYTSTANYSSNQIVPKGSYVLSNGKLTRVMAENGIMAGAFMSYLKYTGKDDNAFMVKNRIDATNYGEVAFDEEDFDEVTNIDDVLLESGIVGSKTNVYNINGMKVRENTDDLRNLPKGIYIVNGKKYIVK